MCRRPRCTVSCPRPSPTPSCHEPLGGPVTSLFPDFLDFSLDNTLWKKLCKFWKVTIEKILTLWVFSAFKKTNSYDIFGKTVLDGERDEAPPRPFCLPFSLLALIARTIKNCCIKSTKSFCLFLKPLKGRGSEKDLKGEKWEATQSPLPHFPFTQAPRVLPKIQKCLRGPRLHSCPINRTLVF